MSNPDDQSPAASSEISLADSVRLREELVDSNDNRWFAGEEFNHSPDHFEREMQFTLRGGLRKLKSRIKVNLELREGSPLVRKVVERMRKDTH